ncbi:MAG: hypothetical protein JWO02_502 [Solirubrobacterales bacterium]|nr:hypothetical protein [Solirubrobacterales bacterium]
MRDTPSIRPLVPTLVLCTIAVGCGADAAPTTTDATTTTTAVAPRRPPTPPALCRADRPRALGRITDPQLDELSGLVHGRRDRRVLFALEDSGAPPVITAVRPDGTVLGRTTVAGATATDWEDIAAGPGPDGQAALFAGDIGDNRATRAAVQIYRLPEPAAATTSTVAAARLDLRYPDGAHDAEALLADPVRRELVIVTKGLPRGRAYTVASTVPHGTTTTLRRGPAVPLGVVTAGDVSADGRLVALRSYATLAIWRRRGREPVARTLGRAPACVAPADLSAEGKGEALALSRDGRSAITVPEGPGAVLRRYG